MPDVAFSIASHLPSGRILGLEELAGAAALIPRVAHIDPLYRHDPGHRICQPLLRTDWLEAWLICWLDDHDTGFHDHDVSSGAVAVVRGTLAEDRMRLGAPPTTRLYPAGAVFSFDASHIHRMHHAGGGPAVSVHVYSPPLGRMGTYDVAPDGVICRTTVPAEFELSAAPALAVA